MRRAADAREGERASAGRGCLERGTLNADRKANRKGAGLFNDLILMDGRTQEPAQGREELGSTTHCGTIQGRCRTECLAACPVSRLRHGSPDVGSSF